MNVRLHVLGTPVPQGNMRAFVAGGKAFVTGTNKGPLTIYRGDIMSAWDSGGPAYAPATGPVVLHCTFVFARPKAHYLPANRSRALPQLRSEAPMWVTTKPDTDKLLRAVADALTGRAYADDSQVVQLHGSKVYGEAAHTLIDVMDMAVHDAEQ